MKTFNLRDAIGKAFLAFSLLLGIGIMSSMTAQAQWPNNRDRDRYDQRDRDNRYDQDRDRDRDRDRGRGRWRRGGRNDGYGNYGGSFQLRQTALNAGFNDGTKAGREDRRRNRSYDPSNHSEYRKGTNDYSSRLGDRYTYQQYYREAFEHGYADGYGGY